MIGIFNPQIAAAMMTGIEKIEKGSPCTTNMEKPVGEGANV